MAEVRQNGFPCSAAHKRENISIKMEDTKFDFYQWDKKRGRAIMV
ncbi:hypothetical protein CLOSTHATH_06270 [Hungatella hathewayi DSM 13479]|jgi:hypothetical protein|uniref:Uncharacterized protein n=1 Tax=Hungatella hathewayi DSM 13479 TaxID=566550 RepID=D3ARL4_9FIRM|nr:hypothetical protein CLOSTHATH_06270 [Hungatella hathewayi DSM 13479]